MIKYVIMADGKYENIYYTGRIGEYWSSDILKAKKYSNKQAAKNIASRFKFNNPRVGIMHTTVYSLS